VVRLGLLAVALGWALSLSAETLLVTVQDARGGPVEEGVVWAAPANGSAPRGSLTAVMDQVDRTFVPHILPVQTGTAVSFPNSDNVRHQVYTISPAKRFQLPLYGGTPPAPVVFDRPGVIALGCNIHDRMSAYVVVVDTPYFAVVEGGTASMSLPPGQYLVSTWIPRERAEIAPRPVKVGAGDVDKLIIRLAAE
jgi:plastocyanin